MLCFKSNTLCSSIAANYIDCVQSQPGFGQALEKAAARVFSDILRRRTAHISLIFRIKYRHRTDPQFQPGAVSCTCSINKWYSSHSRNILTVYLARNSKVSPTAFMHNISVINNLGCPGPVRLKVTLFQNIGMPDSPRLRVIFIACGNNQ